MDERKVPFEECVATAINFSAESLIKTSGFNPIEGEEQEFPSWENYSK